jgi:hypothetical protein
VKTFSIVRTIFVVASLAAGFISTSAHAQGMTEAVSVNVPFGFEIGSKHLAPGTYRVSRPSSNILEISNRSDAAMLITYDGQSSKATKNSKLVFNRYGDHYFLRQVWFTPQDNMYVECTESKAEKQAKRAELEASTKKASNVELASLRIP